MSNNYYFVNKQSIAAYNQFETQLAGFMYKLNQNLREIDVLDAELREQLASTMQHQIERQVKIIETIHIGKRSHGWKPLLKLQPGHYTSIQEMAYWYNQNKEWWEIQDENERVMSWQELNDEVLNWNIHNDAALTRQGINDPFNTYVIVDGREWTDATFS